MEKKPEKVNRAQAEILQDFAATFNTPSGKRVIAYLEKEIGEQCHCPGDLYETLHKSSHRDLLNWIKEKTKRAEAGFEIEPEQEEESNA